MLSIIKLSVIALSVDMLNVVMLSVIMLGVIMLNAVRLHVVMLSVIKLNVVMLNVMVPYSLFCLVVNGRCVCQSKDQCFRGLFQSEHVLLSVIQRILQQDYAPLRSQDLPSR